jgi:hypothetical protein
MLFDNDGTLTAADNSTIVLNSPALTTVESASSAGTSSTSPPTHPATAHRCHHQHPRHACPCRTVTSTPASATVTLVSNASGTGRLGPVAAGQLHGRP